MLVVLGGPERRWAEPDHRGVSVGRLTPSAAFVSTSTPSSGAVGEARDLRCNEDVVSLPSNLVVAKICQAIGAPVYWCGRYRGDKALGRPMQCLTHPCHLSRGRNGGV